MFSILPAAILAAGRFKHFILKDIKLLAIIVLYSILSEIVSISANQLGYNTSILIGIESTIELLLICLYYTAQPKFNILRLLFLFVWLGCAIHMGYCLYQNPFLYPSAAKVGQGFFIVAMSIYFAFKWLTFESAKFYEIIVVIAFFFYYSTTIISFAYANYLPKEWINLFWLVNDLFGILTNLLLFWALRNYLSDYGNNH